MGTMVTIPVAPYIAHRSMNSRVLLGIDTRARVSMPRSTREFIDRCAMYGATGIVTMVPIPLPA